ncbi:unnamed protein product [Sphagnum balticum]
MASLGSWREILQSALQSHKHLKHTQHLQLATVRADGRPANRTLVFRGFVDGTDKVQFTTDFRSQKVEDMKHCPFGEVCYYFSESWEQFRINGILELISSTESDSLKKALREKAWFDSSLRSRASFGSPYPGHPKTSEILLPKLDSSQGPLDNFCVLTLDPKEVDYYDAKKGHRIIFKLLAKQSDDDANSVWSQQEVNP